ncbi:unnamed protein product [Rhizophagus irregularis]|nr:unnamed protein product [Rhizophagus irregularis]CAB5383069.1 unnamed protein product [Rhizophagus irregularis]
MEITRLISNGNPNSIKKQRHSQLLSHINTSATLHHSHKEQLKTTSQIQTQQQSPTHVHHHQHNNNNNHQQQQQLPRILSPVPLSQQPSHPSHPPHTILIPSPIPLHHHHQQSIPTPPQSTQIPLMDLHPPPPQSQQQSQTPTHTPPNRRIAHILSEQKRRENINSGFEELKSIVPSCRGCADSKAVILRKAVHYIQTLESEIQKLKQPNNSPTTPNASTTAPSPAMSVKSGHNVSHNVTHNVTHNVPHNVPHNIPHNVPHNIPHTIPPHHNVNGNGNISLPSITTLPQMQLHGNTTGPSVYNISDFNNQEKNVQNGHLLEHQKQQQYMSQWHAIRMNQNYELSSPTHQSHYQHRQIYHQQMHNHQKSFTHPVPRHHSQYSENINWNTAGDGDYY